MRRSDLDVRHVGGLFAVVFLVLSAVDLVVDGRVSAKDVVLNVVAAAAVVGASLFPTFRLPGRRGEGARITAAAVVAGLLAAVLVVAALIV